ncbi:STAS domain-containing protein [Streptomyces sp. NPDC051453]|uniref:STAS domain-containing protein n=1 Tax=Streptomyces sp. NPDC051453 TaxID=3154941 RepID=UPI003448C0EC
MQPAIRISHRELNGWTVVEAIGEVDVSTALQIRAYVLKLLEEGREHFVLDLSHVPFLDSMGLGIIVAITKRIRAREGSLHLVCFDEHVLKVFWICDLRRVYRFYDSVAQASRRAPRRGGLARWPHKHPRPSPASSGQA